MAYEDLIRNYRTEMSPLPTAITPGGHLAGEVHCVLFDIYGTLFISGSGDISAARKSSAPGQKLEHLVCKYAVGKPARTLVSELHAAIELEHLRSKKNGTDYPEIEIDRIWRQILGFDDIQMVRKFAVEYELIVNPVYPMPGLNRLLSACRRQGLAMGIISNAQFFTPLLFEWFLDGGIEDQGFDSELVFLSYRVGCAKPSAKLFKMAASAIEDKGFDAAASLFVGNDMLNDIYPAHRVGFQTALFAGDARSLRLREDDSRCADLSADLILTDLGQLVDHIASENRGQRSEDRRKRSKDRGQSSDDR